MRCEVLSWEQQGNSHLQTLLISNHLMASLVTTAHISTCGVEVDWFFISAKANILQVTRRLTNILAGEHGCLWRHIMIEKKGSYSVQSVRGFWIFVTSLSFFLSFTHAHTHTVPSTKMCHSSTPCQHFTDSYRHWGAGRGGRAGMLAGGREKEERRGGRAVLGWKQVLWCCAERKKMPE